ncbi:MAG: SprT-like domain-containing protein [Bacteroidota bacterium]
MTQYKVILEKYIPKTSVDLIYDWLQQYNIHLKVSRKRSTKLGDYRPPQNGNGHHITVNHDLNQYAFLITLVHEVAHLIIWEKHRNKVRAHGKEWKETYRELMLPFLEMEIFPQDIHDALQSYLGKSYASSGSDLKLSRTLQKYDEVQGLTLEMLDEGSIFRLPNGRTFAKGKLMRKRYRCVSLDNKRIYLVNPLAKVELTEATNPQ